MRFLDFIRRREPKEPKLDLETVIRERRRQSAQWREEILQKGCCVLHPESNVAPGSYGYEVLKLAFDGHLEGRRHQTGPLTLEYITHYAITPSGMAMARMMQD